MRNLSKLVYIIILLGVFLLCFTPSVYANTFYSDYGSSRTHNIAVTTGTHSFQVDGIAQYKWTEWYVNGQYTGESENDYSGFLAIDPEYTRSISGTIKIEAVVYNDGWGYEETHTWNLSIAKPDLIVQDIKISPSSPTAGQSATITATLKNQGNADAGKFYLRYYIDGSPIGEDNVYFGLNPGESDDESIPYTVGSSGNHTVRVFVDYKYEISESNEGNNTREETYYWQSPPKPDLIVQDIKISPSSPIAGQSATITATLKNQGNANAGKFYLRYYIDGSPIGEDNVYYGLNPGESNDESIPYTVGSSGNHTVRVFVDYKYEISESNEGNNTREETYNWLNPTGNLIVTVENQNSNSTSGAKVIRYTTNWDYIDEKWTDGNGNATWLSIDVGDYKLEAYYNDEYWVNSSATVSQGSTEEVTLHRNEPYAFEFAVFDVNTNTEVTNSTIPAGTPLRYEVRVLNDSPDDRSARVKLWVDHNQASQYDFYETSSYHTISKNGNTHTFTFNDSQASTGDFYRRLEIETYVNSNHVRTDSWGWGEAYTIVDYSDASIVQFTPPTGTLQRGNQTQATVRVMNTGTTTRSFWIGLSLAEPGATLAEWPEGWYDIPPIQSQILTHDDEQTLEFDFELFWWLPPGTYTAVTAIWEGYDPVDNLMVEPRYDDQIMESFTLEPYSETDLFQNRVFTPVDIDSLDNPSVFLQQLTDYSSWLNSRSLNGARVTIERISSNGVNAATLRINIDIPEPDDIDYYIGKGNVYLPGLVGRSQVAIVVPNGASIIRLSTKIDGQSDLEWIGSDLISALFLLVGSGAETTIGQLISYSVNKAAEEITQQGWSYASSYVEIPLSYETMPTEEGNIYLIDFLDSDFGDGYTDFDGLELEFDIYFENEAVPIGIMTDLRYKLKWWKVLLRQWEILLTNSVLYQEYRRCFTVFPSAFDINTDVKDINTPVLPDEYTLSQNYPNPFNPETQIEFSLPRTSNVTIEIFNILGQRVRTLVDKRLSAGNKIVSWDSRDDNGFDVSSGTYFYRISAGDFVESKKMILLK